VLHTGPQADRGAVAAAVGKHLLAAHQGIAALLAAGDIASPLRHQQLLLLLKDATEAS
jgi:hypothetical protein